MSLEHTLIFFKIIKYNLAEGKKKVSLNIHLNIAPIYKQKFKIVVTNEADKAN
jgi:hypothetical protein